MSKPLKFSNWTDKFTLFETVSSIEVLGKLDSYM